MATAEELRVIIKAEVDKARRDLKKFQRTTKDTGGAVTDLKKKLGAALAGGALIAGAARVGRAIGDLRREASSLASKAEEVRSKFDVVFGRQAGEVAAWAERYAQAMGRGSTATQEYLSAIQDTLVPLGFARRDAAELSKEVVTLAGDLASFNDLDTADVLRSIQSGIVGNYENFRRFGVVVNEAAVKQELLNSGLWNGEDAIDAQAKAQAALNLVMKGTTDAQGDLARTSDSYANTQRRLEAATKDLKEALGAGFNTVSKPWISFLADLSRGAAQAVVGLNRTVGVMEKLKETSPNLFGREEAEAALKEYQWYVDERERLQKKLQETATTALGLTLLDPEVSAELERVNAQIQKMESSGATRQLIDLPSKEQAKEAEGAISDVQLRANAFYAELRKGMGDIAKQGEVFGESFDAAQAKGALLQNVLTSMISDGFDPAGAAIEHVLSLYGDWLPKQKELTKEGKRFNEESGLALDIANKLARAENDYQKHIAARLEEYDRGKMAEKLEKERKALLEARDAAQALAKEYSDLAMTITRELGQSFDDIDFSKIGEQIGAIGGPVGSYIGSFIGDFVNQVKTAIAQDDMMAGEIAASLTDVWKRAAEAGDYEQFKEALSGKLIDAVLQAGMEVMRVEQDIKKLAKQVTRAYRDGVLDESERARILETRDRIEGKMNLAAENVAQMRSELPELFGRAPVTSSDNGGSGGGGGSNIVPFPYRTAGTAAAAPMNQYYNINVAGSVTTEENLAERLARIQSRQGYGA